MEYIYTWDVIEQLFKRVEDDIIKAQQEKKKKEMMSLWWCWHVRWILDILDLLTFAEQKRKIPFKKETDSSLDDVDDVPVSLKKKGRERVHEIYVNLQSLYFAHPCEFGITSDSAILKVILSLFSSSFSFFLFFLSIRQKREEKRE